MVRRRCRPAFPLHSYSTKSMYLWKWCAETLPASISFVVARQNQCHSQKPLCFSKNNWIIAKPSMFYCNNCFRDPSRPPGEPRAARASKTPPRDLQAVPSQAQINTVWGIVLVSCYNVFSTLLFKSNYAEFNRNFAKRNDLEPTCAKFDKKSEAITDKRLSRSPRPGQWLLRNPRPVQ